VQSLQTASFPAIPDRNRLNFSWLMKLRWAEIAGQSATIAGVAWILDIALPLLPLVVIVAVELVSNLVAARWFRDQPVVAEWHLAFVMALDVALLTGLLYFTGGPRNPFSFLYLVQIALAAVVLRAHWTWMLVALSLGSFGLLLITHRDLPHLSASSMHQRGMWVAMGVASAFIVHFLLRVVAALAERERELTEARHLAARQERMASLATMAAGAAHELSTPLGTIALVAKELEHALSPQGEPGMIDDARLIREQVGRCRVILDQMAGGAGEHPGEGIEAVAVAVLVGEALEGARGAPPVVLDLVEGAERAVVRVPPRAMAQALRSVITNAQDASSAGGEVRVVAMMERGVLTIEVLDRGRGMTEDVLMRVGEPFFTTKEPGRGMGLGLFLTRAVVESLGGSLDIDSSPGQGTCVVMRLPVTPVAPG
jgi:two-component system sensor histidine kinase RegB